MATLRFEGASDIEDRAIRQIVALAMDAPHQANSGHSGTAMALAPLGVTLFSRVLRHDPLDASWADRDRFILSAGHVSILQYALAATFGYGLEREDLVQFRQAHSRTPGHPEADLTPTVEVTTGPLGQGFANGVGMAIAERLLRAQHGEDLVSHRTWVIAGDGCLEEGVSHEAASLAGALGVDRLTVFYDDNHITIDGPTELALDDDTASRFRAYGWHVIDLGERTEDLDALERACAQCVEETDRPSLVILRTHIATPSPTMSDRREAHGVPFSAQAISEVKSIIEVPDEPFVLDAELTERLVASLSAGAEERRAWEARVAAAGAAGDKLIEQLRTGGVNSALALPAEFDPGRVATRKALQRALDELVPRSSGVVIGSADLSENTGVAVADVAVHTRDTPAGRRLYYGVREFAMGAIMVGMARHGGVRPVGSTFFVFSDYERPAIRLAALSHSPVLFAFSHDSIGVGEDGPTHQPVEQLMSLRAMPNLHVVRPSDANEALRLVHGLLTSPVMAPTALVLTRQDVSVLEGPDADASRAGASRGGYVLREPEGAQVTLLATGSEVSVALAACDSLARRGVGARVAALPCWACFDDQPANYRDSVLRRDLPSVAVEAGATLGWTRYADEALGIDTFGMSAPGGYLFEYLNITAEALEARVLERLAEKP
jgi:transketolase